MSKLGDLLSLRLQRNKPSQKTSELAQKSSEGQLSGIAGLLNKGELSDAEKAALRGLLEKYAREEGGNIDKDFDSLATITTEVKSINNQAAMLHGERIKHAQTILKNYQDGAFTAWLLTVYGNRQTPYNFLQYYDFFQEMPRNLHKRIESMPRQAVYVLASRTAGSKEKKRVIENAEGKTKDELLEIIREEFPIDLDDKRRSVPADKVIKALTTACNLLQKKDEPLSKQQQDKVAGLLDVIKTLVTIKNVNLN